MPLRPSFTAGDLGFSGPTTKESTNPSKADIPLAGPSMEIVGAANKMLQNAPVFWLVAILAVLGMLKFGFEFGVKTGVNAGVK